MYICLRYFDLTFLLYLLLVLLDETPQWINVMLNSYFEAFSPKTNGRWIGLNLNPPYFRFASSSCLISLSRWWFHIFFYFNPYLGNIPILTNSFQRGWNHQLVMNFNQLHKEIYEQSWRKTQHPLGMRVNEIVLDSNRGCLLPSRVWRLDVSANFGRVIVKDAQITLRNKRILNLIIVHPLLLLPLGRYPRLPQTPTIWKKFVQKLLVKGPGYLLGVCGWDLKRRNVSKNRWH